MEDIFACRVCLATDVKLFNMYKYNLVNTFQMVTGINISPSDPIPHQLCSFCVTQLYKSKSFQQKCRSAQELLHCAVLQGDLLTTDYIRSIDRKTHKLNHPYTTQNTSLIIKLEQGDQNDSKNDTSTSAANIDKIDVKMNYEIKLEHDSDYSDEIPLSNMVKKKKKRKEKVTESKVTVKEEIEIEYDSFGNNDSLVDNDDSLVIDDDSLIVNDERIDGKDVMEIVILSKEQQRQEVLNRQNSCNYKNSAFKCHLCFKGFMTDVTFKNHMIRHEESFGPLECDICHIRAPDMRALRGHKSCAHERQHRCRICSHVAKNSYSARMHVRWHQGFLYKCDICGSTFDKQTSQLSHVRIHHPSSHACDVCGDTFVSGNGLRLHKKKAHQTSSPNTATRCPSCSIQFRNTTAYNRHLSAQGGECKRGIACIHCGEVFSSDKSLAEHYTTHRRTLKCEECNRTFVHARSFAIHNHRVHLGVKYVTKKIHAAPTDTVVCELCGKTCINRTSLINHQRTHTGEKPFQCKECPKRFTIRQRLQIHMRTHTGERPYKCPHCPKGFPHKAALNRHVRVHTGVKPYSCVHCGKAFSQSNSLKTHIATVHLKIPAPYKKSARKEQYLDS